MKWCRTEQSLLFEELDWSELWRELQAISAGGDEPLPYPAPQFIRTDYVSALLQVDLFLREKLSEGAIYPVLEAIVIRYPGEYTLMVLDRAPSHRSGKLQIPHNIQILTLPPYSLQLNPQENRDEM